MKIISEQTMDITTLNQLERLAADLIRHCATPARIGLIGDLGAGKTTFVQHLARQLRIKTSVISPTFAIRQSYPILFHTAYQRLVHYDLYRLNSLQELAEVGMDEDISDEMNLVVIEWADRIGDFKQQLTDQLTFTWNSVTDQRIVIWQCQAKEHLPVPVKGDAR